MTNNNRKYGIHSLSPLQKREIDSILLARYGAICQWCWLLIDRTLPMNHDMSWSRDHIIAVRYGGTNHPSNLQPMHRICNLNKDTSELEAESNLEVQLKRLQEKFRRGH